MIGTNSAMSRCDEVEVEEVEEEEEGKEVEDEEVVEVEEVEEEGEKVGFFFRHTATASISGTTTATNLLSVLIPCKNSWDTSGTWVKIPSICMF
jgi:hypothetical protein